MKVTIMHADVTDLIRVVHIIAQYMNSGYADGSRPKQRDCVVFSNRADNGSRAAAVWGGPDHIRVAFEAEDPRPCSRRAG